MEHQLLVASLCLALIVAVASFLFPALRGAPPADNPATPRLCPSELAALALPFLGLVVTLPTHAPFSAGQGLGRGFLIGGIGAALAALAARRLQTPIAGGTILSLPALAVGITLLVLRNSLLDSLLGVAIGWFSAGFLFYRARRDDASANPTAILAGLGFAVTLVAAALLGTLRDPRTEQLAHGTWSAAALAFAAGCSLFVLIAALLRGAPRAGVDSTLAAPATIAAIGLSGVLAVLLGLKFVDERRLIALLAIGLLLYPLIYWLTRTSQSENPGGRALRLTPRFAGAVPYLGVVLIVSAAMIGGQLMQGFGFALALVAMYIAWACGGGAVSAAPLRLLLFGTALVLYRAFLARWSDDLHGVGVADQYALFGLVVGAAAPALIAGIAGGVRIGRTDGARPLISSGLAGLLALAVPGCVTLIFGPKCALALILGASLAGVFTEDYLPLLLTIGMALAMDQWSDKILPYADLARIVKIKALAVVLGVIIAATAASAGRKPAGLADDSGAEANKP